MNFPMNPLPASLVPLAKPTGTWHNTLETDVLIVGAGIAGLSLALRLPDSLRVLVVTKGALGDSNTWYAQGGLAAAVGPDDDPALHFEDTIAAGAGLCDENAVRELVEGGPPAVQWLLEHGTRFDYDARQLALGREAAHSRNRVLHAGGDATGAEIERSLVAQLRARPTVSVIERTAAIDLVTLSDGSCGGALVTATGSNRIVRVVASNTVLANGGAGQLWAVSSNPPGATGDGIAMALRAGVAVADLEFTQFHPTVLATPGIDPFLITEAIRGEGAYLLDGNGHRFMVNAHELAELAPRDVVAREIQHQITSGHDHAVFLDLRHLDPELMLRRFPTIAQRLASYDLSLTEDLIPVAPAAHYFMGGIVADTCGRTSMPRLYAIGEVSCTGVHGANRLASNSLLEGLVFGLRAADEISTTISRDMSIGREHGMPDAWATPDDRPHTELKGLRKSIQQAMSAHVAVVRDADGLTSTVQHLIDLAPQLAAFPLTASLEVRNILLLSVHATAAALERQESRGAHFRKDFPETDPSLDLHHQVIQQTTADTTRRFGPLMLDAAP
jgi:L-aspartate oxidase